ncbi:GPA5, alpha subunit of a heterotrimeric G protein [Ochromonadaceae sp. CCMP2298]|nr:GPA5, alpha subunit of a heterotrimeric G protein [Ochromonadaceae sp. CCMP2298]
MLLAKAAKVDRFKLQVLLLGAGESGKSTVVKQLKALGNVLETEDEKKKYVSALRRNIIEAMQVLLQASKTLGVPLENKLLEETAEKVSELANECSSEYFPADLAIWIDALWKDPGIQRVYARRSEYWLMDATPFYLDEVYRITDPLFEITEEDIIMARVRSTGIVISDVVERPYTFQLVDVGGQRSERRKWIDCFDNVDAIIYLASLSGYNQVLFEDQQANIMRESLTLFKDIMQNPIFKATPIFVFLNKKDLVEESLKTSPLTAGFEDYDGPDFEVQPAIEFIKSKFIKITAEHCPGKMVHFHIVAARVRMDMKIAFAEVKQVLKSLHPIHRKSTMHRPASPSSPVSSSRIR